MTTLAAGFDSFRHKLFDTHRELLLIEQFLPPVRRAGVLAFECLVHELGDTALRIEEPQVADAKLAWWFAEIESSLAGAARHPITQSLLPQAVDVPRHRAVGALRDAAQALRRESVPVDAASQLRTMSQWFEALLEFGRVAGVLHHADCARAAPLRAAHQLARELARLRPGASVSHLTLPLNLLARHQLSRADLCTPTEARDAAVRDQLAHLQTLLTAEAESADLVSRVRRRLDLVLLRGAATARDPCAFLARELGRLRMTTAWHVWREARAYA